jgi:phosphohistidine phosphatase SixA
MQAMNRRTHLLTGWRAACGWVAFGWVARATGAPAPRPAPGDGRVLLLRHARAPGTFDPPGFRLGDCSTQRNLDAEGRAQAQAVGRWFERHGQVVERVRSSPWCRCMETAQLAFGRVEAWDALGSPVNLSLDQKRRQVVALTQALGEVKAQGGLHVWVSHMFVQEDLTGQSTPAGEGLLIQATEGGPPAVMGTWRFKSAAPCSRSRPGSDPVQARSSGDCPR